MKTASAIALAMLACGLAASGIFAIVKDRQAEKETTAFVNDTVSELSDGWHPKTLIERAEPGLVKAITGEGKTIGDLFRIYGKLGALTEEPQCQLKDTSQFEGTGASYMTASYGCELQYERGPATILITVRKSKGAGDWKIYYLNVSSSYFAELNYHGKK